MKNIINRFPKIEHNRDLYNSIYECVDRNIIHSMYIDDDGDFKFSSNQNMTITALLLKSPKMINVHLQEFFEYKCLEQWYEDNNMEVPSLDDLDDIRESQLE